MQKYHVYGIGNALVDIEYEVSPEFLANHGIQKGLMTLVDRDRQIELNEKITIGHHKRCCGGSAANTLIAVAQLGGNAFYSCKVASDDAGDFYFEDLKNEGVDSNLEDGRKDGMTGRCMVFVTPDADRTMNTFLGISEGFSKSELRESSLKDSNYLYIEGYLVTSDTGRAAAISAREIARENDVKVAMTFSDPFMVANFKHGLKEMAGEEKLDLLFCNESEALSFTEKENLDDAVIALKTSAETFAITCGENGAIVFDGEKVIHIETDKVDAKDSNGAGDLFAGAFMYGISNGLDFEKAGKLACKASSKLVTQFGARLEKSQILEIKSQVL